MSNVNGSMRYNGFDAMGRVTSSTQTIAGEGTYTIPSYVYNQAGNVTSFTYPSGRVVQTVWDGVGRPVKVSRQASQGWRPMQRWWSSLRTGRFAI